MKEDDCLEFFPGTCMGGVCDTYKKGKVFCHHSRNGLLLEDGLYDETEVGSISLSLKKLVLRRFIPGCFLCIKSWEIHLDFVES